ncbi:ankyrin repeat domain-containing protein 29-like [Magallana gigas]|uniref:ankyrin repeat domain-containing protein 29-like n=1 Tax=Magallana gigas TaxID=29159 RepID=UPI00333FC17D
MMGVIHGMEYVQPLINKGANLNIKNKRNQTALSFALRRLMAGDTEMVCYLVENGADPNMDKDGNTPLLYATLNRNLKMVSKLVNAGANPDCRNAQGQTALHIAAWNGYTDIVDLLLKTGMEHDTRTNDGNTPLSLAAHGNHLEVINMLLPLGCNVNNVDKDDDTPLLYATFNSNLKMVCKLVNAGADPDCRNHHNTTPLWNAVYKNDQDTIRYLLVKNVELEVSSRGTDQHARSNVATVIYPVPRSLLYVAALQCSVDVVMTLILAGYNIYKELIPYDIYTPMRGVLIKFSSSPSSLLSICRVFFRRRFKGNVEENVSSLNIPENLKNSLMLKNFIPEEFFKM